MWLHVYISCNERLPHPLLFVLCVCKQLPDVGLRLSDVLVENLGTVDNLWLPGLEHLTNLSCHQGFATAWGSEQQDSLHMLTAWRHTCTARDRGAQVKLYYYFLLVVKLKSNFKIFKQRTFKSKSQKKVWGLVLCNQ